jgi:hypothetical protein
MSEALLEHCCGPGEILADAAGFVADLVVGEAERGHAGDDVGAVAQGVAFLG